MKRYVALIGAIVLIAVGVLLIVNERVAKAPTDGRACTQEAKLCSDGSAVGRTGPNCEFALCPAEVAAKDCKPSGCSGQVCSDQEIMTTCEFRQEYACYQTARCERQATGTCGWTMTKELGACLANPPT